MAPTPGPILETPNPIGNENNDGGGGYLVSPRNNSLTVTNTKGLLNMPGQNNCFLNSAVQVLWHLDIFRRSFRELSGHACMAESCIFCALKELFTQFQYSQESALPPDALRHALARTFCDQRRFQLGFMDDAAECFENILLRIHVHIANQEHEDMCGNLQCIPHQKFAMTIVEQPMCTKCGTSSEPLPFTQMVHYVTTSALCSKALELHKQGVTVPNSFGTLLQLAGDVGEVRKCSSNCGSKIHVKKTLMNHPEIVSIGLVWDSDCSSAQHITDVFHCIGMCLRLKDMFHTMYDVEWGETTYHELVGVVTYYGKHYSTFFFHTKLRVWIYFDDAAVREIGPSWDSVVEKCQKGRFQPLLLLFANPNGASLTPSTVSQEIPMHHAACNPSTKLANMKHAIIQKYLSLQNKMPNDFARVNYKDFREWSNNYEHQYQRHDIQAYQSAIPNLPNSMRSQMVLPNSKACNSNVPVYSNASAIGIPIPTSNYANTNHPNSLPNHIYSNIHVSNFQGHNHSESLPHMQTTGKANDVCLPPLHNSSKYSSRGNAPPYIENPEMLQYKHQDMADLTKDSDSAFTEEDPENETYISRKTVENVLNLQRHMTLSRSYSHTSVGNRNSSSSLESFDNVHCAKLNNNAMVTDAANFSRRRDSGHWSGDRNSSSSSTSVENPFLTVFAAKRLMLGLNNCHASVVGKGQLPDYSNPNTSDHGYDSYSVSSSDSYPSITNSPVKLDPRLTQIPEDWTGQEYTDNLDSKLKMVTEESGPPDCDKLCAEADLLLAKSHEKEKEGDLVMAALLSDSAAARARTAMDAPYNNSRSLVSAKMKHSTCVMRSSCLYRRLKDNEADERRKAKGHHSRQSSRDSTHSRHSRQGSKDNTHGKQSPKETSNQVFEDLENFGKNIEIYGTLPKKGNKKKTSMTTLNSKAKDDQVYKDFLDKQRKNTSIGNMLTEHKNSKATNHPDSTKTKPNEKSPKSGSAETVPKPPQRKNGIILKEDLKQSGLPKKGKQKQPIEQSYFALFSPHDGESANDADLAGRDLLSPLSSPDKKQHRIKRKLMGGFMKRKNRSLPDLRADEELSDDFERSIDDAAISGSSTLTLPNGTLKKLENLADASVSNMSRGFHQPHYAFVKKDLTQRPLLMKVNPPNVQCPPLTVPVPKQTHTLPSLPKKLIESKPRNDIHFSSDKPSKIPFMASLAKSENPIHLHPIKSETKSTPPYAPQKMSSIPVLSSPPLPSPIKSDIPKDSSSETAIINNLVPNDDLPLPSNSFLAEIQAKRKQIIDTKDNSLPKKEIKPTKPLQPIANKGLPSHLPKLAPTGNNEGTSWLKELQTKQLQMKHKQSDTTPALSQPELVTTEISKEKIPKSINHSIPKTNTTVTPLGTPSIAPEVTQAKSAINPSYHPPDSSNYIVERNGDKKSPGSVKEVKSAITSSYHSPDSSNYIAERNSDKKSPGSVKDLASKFEKILTKPKESVSEPNNDNVKSPSTPKLVRQQSVSEVKCDQMENRNLTLPDEEKKSEPYHSETQKPSPPSEQRQTHTSPANTSVQRPQQPPDYETAMQRLELIRTNASAVSSNMQQNSSETDNRFPSVARQVISDLPKKKLGPKKTVTFSDEVVLVACAEFDDSGFFSNPLLERVYQKHIESGGNEISHFSGVSNHKTNDSPDVNNHNHQPVPTGQIARYDNASGDSSELIPCHLCHNKYVSSGSTYCTDCAFYMSRFQP